MQSPDNTPDLNKGDEIPIEPTSNDIRYTPDPTIEPKKKSIAIPAILGVAALLAIGFFLKSKSGSKPAAPDAAKGPRLTSVRVTPVSTGTIVETLPLTGQLKSNQDININSKIAGQVARVYVDEGQRVERGQLLVSLDTGDLNQQVDSARANLQAAQVKLDQARVGLPARVAQVNNAVREAQSQVNSAAARLRQAQLSAPTQSTNARSQVESAKAAISSAQARVKQARETAKQTQGQVNAGIAQAQGALGQARAQLEQVKNGSRNQQVAQAQAQVSQAQAQVEQSDAQVNLAQAQVNDAQTNLTRQQTLYRGGATAKANVDTAQTALEVAKASLESVRANREAARSSVESAKQQLSLIREGSRTEEVRQSEQIVAQREAALQSANSGRSQILAAQAQVSDALGALAQSQEGLRQANANLSTIPSSQQDIVTAQQALNQSRTQLQTAQANRAQIPVAQADVPAAEAAVAGARSQLEQAQLNLGYAQIKAPVAGVVNTKAIDSGETVAPGATLLNVVSTNSVIFEAQVPASQLGQIEVGQPANISIASQGNKQITGYVTEVIPVADARLRQFRVRISIEGDNLTPGAFAQGILQTQVSRDTLTVPTEDVRTGDGNPYVYVAVADGDNATAKKRTVKIGTQANGKTQILSGLSVGDKVIQGNALYDDGQKIKVSKEA